jgi:hypothetical protein
MPTQHSNHPSTQIKTLAFQSLHIPLKSTDNMASSQYQTKDSILPISNTDFFKHNHCPMRTVNTRCRCLSTCKRVDFGDDAGSEKALMLRNQILQQIKPFKNEASISGSAVWNDIETKVDMLMGWVLCKKHMLDHSAAAQMTMRFLKQDIGIFVGEQSAQLHPTAPATITNNAAPSQLVSSVPAPMAASAASHLATPPLSPATRAQETLYQHYFASQPLNDGAAFDPSSKPPQQSPFALHMNIPVKTAPAIEVPGTHAHQNFRSTTSHGIVNNGTTSNNTVSRKERAPYGFGVCQPSKTRFISGNKSGKQPHIKSINAQTQLEGPTVRRHAAVKASNHQHEKPKAPRGFTVRERSADRAPVAQPCLPQTSNSPTYAHDKHRDSFDVSRQNASVRASPPDVDELVERLKAAELRNKQLEDEGHGLEDMVARLEDNNQRLLVANKQLLEAKKHYKGLHQDAKDRLEELEGEHDGLEDELDESREHIVKLEEELAVLRRPARGRSVKRRGYQ